MCQAGGPARGTRSIEGAKLTEDVNTSSGVRAVGCRTRGSIEGLPLLSLISGTGGEKESQDTKGEIWRLGF